MVTIQPMTQQDDRAVSLIVSECYHFIAATDGITPGQRERLIAERCQPEHMAINRARYTCHVAEDEGAVVGFIAASASNIEELFVPPDHHRRGVATALFHKVEGNCRADVLTVSTTGFGVPFYQAMGMHIIGKRMVSFGPLEGRELIQLEKRKPNKSVEPTRALSSARGRP